MIKNVSNCIPCDDVLKNLNVRGVNIGKELKKRLNDNGKVSEDRVVQYENQWTRKLACFNDAHSKINGITVEEANEILDRLSEFANGGKQPACPQNQKEVLDCLTKNQRKPLLCHRIVEDFTKCVDETLLATSRLTNVSCIKKPTYTEKFHQDPYAKCDD